MSLFILWLHIFHAKLVNEILPINRHKVDAPSVQNQKEFKESFVIPVVAVKKVSRHKRHLNGQTIRKTIMKREIAYQAITWFSQYYYYKKSTNQKQRIQKNYNLTTLTQNLLHPKRKPFKREKRNNSLTQTLTHWFWTLSSSTYAYLLA